MEKEDAWEWVGWVREDAGSPVKRLGGENGVSL